MSIDSEDRSLLIVYPQHVLIALDRTTGAERWRTELPPGANQAEIAVGQGWVVVCSAKHLSFVEYASGRLAASIPHGISVTSRPTMLIDQGQILLAIGDHAMAYTTSGQLLWKQQVKGGLLDARALALPGNARQADYEH
jgi:outer membrane protein assembly factor BamB